MTSLPVLLEALPPVALPGVAVDDLNFDRRGPVRHFDDPRCQPPSSGVAYDHHVVRLEQVRLWFEGAEGCVVANAETREAGWFYRDEGCAGIPP